MAVVQMLIDLDGLPTGTLVMGEHRRSDDVGNYFVPNQGSGGEWSTIYEINQEADVCQYVRFEPLLLLAECLDD